MRFLRSLFSVTLIDKIKSEAIKTQLREDNTVAEIRCYQGKWRQHVMRMCTNIFPQCALTDKPLGKQDLEQPRMRWTDQQVFGPSVARKNKTKTTATPTTTTTVFLRIFII
jgi:uncharacterized Fe-S center protein